MTGGRELLAMGALKRMAMFGGGGLLGAAVGVVTAYLAAPQSGDELKAKVNERVAEAKAAGAAAEAAKHEELIRRFRADIGDPDALRNLEGPIPIGRQEAATAAGLSFNAPGALTAHEYGRRLERMHAGTAPPVPAEERPNPALERPQTTRIRGAIPPDEKS